MLKETILSKIWIYISALIVFFSPINMVFVGVGVLIFIDLMMGIMGSIKIGERISSRKLSQTLIKMLVYNLLIISAFMIEKTLITFIPFMNITLTFLAITEFYSIGENFSKIMGVNFIVFIKKVVMGNLKKYSDAYDNVDNTDFNKNKKKDGIQ